MHQTDKEVESPLGKHDTPFPGKKDIADLWEKHFSLVAQSGSFLLVINYLHIST